MKAAFMMAPAFLALAAAMGKTQSLEAIDKADAAVFEAWEKTPLIIRYATFVSAEPEGFGVYSERESSAFKPGEALIVYAEPVGYSWKENDDSTYNIAFSLDLSVLDTEGSILFGKRDFLDLEKTSKKRNREFLLQVVLNIEGLPPDDYIAEFKAHDLNSGETAMFELPFSIVD